MMVITLAAIVEARIDEDVGGNILVELEGKRVFPFVLHTFVAGKAIHSRFPLDILLDLPCKIDGEQRTHVVKNVLTFFETIARGECQTINILEVICSRTQVNSTLQFMVQPVDVIIHTEREVHREWRHDVGEDKGIVCLIVTHELGVGKELGRVVPVLGGLKSQLRGIAEEVLRCLQCVK